MKELPPLGHHLVTQSDSAPRHPYQCDHTKSWKCKCHQNPLKIATSYFKGDHSWPWMGHEKYTGLPLFEFLNVIPVRCVTLLPEFLIIFKVASSCFIPLERQPIDEIACRINTFAPAYRPKAAKDNGTKLGNIKAIMHELDLDGEAIEMIYDLMDQKGVTREQPANNPVLSVFNRLKTAYALKVLQIYVYDQDHCSQLTRAMKKMTAVMRDTVQTAWVEHGWRGEYELRSSRPPMLKVGRTHVQSFEQRRKKHLDLKVKREEEEKAVLTEMPEAVVARSPPVPVKSMAGGQFTIAIR